MTITQPLAGFIVSRPRLRELIEQVCAKVVDATACRKLEPFLDAPAEASLDVVLHQFAWLRIRSTS
jgi:hypothetical protein